MYYKCVKFHKNPISGLGGVALTRYMERRTDRRTDGQGDSYIPPPPQTFFAGCIIKRAGQILPEVYGTTLIW